MNFPALLSTPGLVSTLLLWVSILVYTHSLPHPPHAQRTMLLVLPVLFLVGHVKMGHASGIVLPVLLDLLGYALCAWAVWRTAKLTVSIAVYCAVWVMITTYSAYEIWLLLWGHSDGFTLSLLGEGGLSINLYTILFILLFGIGYGAYYATADMPIPMVADCSDYETYQSGKYIPGIMGTLFSLVDKLVSSLSATVVGVAVSFIGLESLPTQYDPYTPGMNAVVIVLFCVIPMVAWAATLIAMKGYSLTGEKMKEIQAVNACRRDAVAARMSLEDAMQKYVTMADVPESYVS